MGSAWMFFHSLAQDGGFFAAANLDCDVKWGEPCCVLKVGIGTVAQKHFDGADVSFGGGNVKRGVAVGVVGIQFSSAPDE